MKEPLWLSQEALESMHLDLTREHGGTPGIRDEGLLQSALARPRQKYSYDDELDLPSLGAAYGFGLAKNRPFIDGNKRIALMAVYTFLLLNGLELVASEAQAVEIITGVAGGSVGEKALSRWIASNVVPYRE